MTRAKRKVQIEKAISLTENDLVAFRHGFLLTGDAEVKSPAFHHEWSDILLNKKGNFAVEAFRESGKSQIVVRSFLLHALFYPSKKNDYIVLVKATATQASSKLKEIQREFLSHPILSANVRKIYDQSGDTFSLDVVGRDGEVVNVRIDAYGKGASMRGLSTYDRRPSTILIDDPQDKEDADSDVILAKDWDWFLSDIMFLGTGKTTRIFMIGNNLGEKCIIERVFAGKELLNFTCVKIPIMDTNGATWKEKYKLEDILKEREDFRRLGKGAIWEREKMCLALAEEDRVFHKDDFRYFGAKTVDNLVKGTNVYFLVDPASSTEKDSCYRAIVVVAVDRDNNWFILDVPYGRWDSSVFIDTLFDKVRQWKPRSVGIEKGMLKQILEPFLLKEMPKRNVFFDIKDIEHAKQGTKLERVKMLAPRFKAHTVWFPDEAHWLAEMESELLGVTRDSFKSLYVDLIDALSMTFQIAETPFNFSGVDIKHLPREASVVTNI